MSIDMITFENDGPRIRATNYWQSEHARRGFAYLSGNAGALRLLVPGPLEGALDEMRTGKSVTIEPSISAPRCWDVVLEDGSDEPYALTIDRAQVDRALTPGRCTLTVWTRDGQQMEMQCTVKAE